MRDIPARQTVSLDRVELSALGIFPQLHKTAFVRDVVDIINKELQMVSIAQSLQARLHHLTNHTILSDTPIGFGLE